VPGYKGRRLILLRLMSRISSDGISQSCTNRPYAHQHLRFVHLSKPGKTKTHDLRKRR
jgi:hypothetical protein